MTFSLSHFTLSTMTFSLSLDTDRPGGRQQGNSACRAGGGGKRRSVHRAAPQPIGQTPPELRRASIDVLCKDRPARYGKPRQDGEDLSLPVGRQSARGPEDGKGVLHGGLAHLLQGPH